MHLLGPVTERRDVWDWRRPDFRFLYDWQSFDWSLSRSERRQLNIRRRRRADHSFAMGLLLGIDIFSRCEFSQVYASQYESGVALAPTRSRLTRKEDKRHHRKSARESVDALT